MFNVCLIKQVHRVGSSLIMKITLTYIAFTMFLYSLIVFGLMGPEFENVKESWFLIMLFTDVPKVLFMSFDQRLMYVNVMEIKLRG